MSICHFLDLPFMMVFVHVHSSHRAAASLDFLIANPRKSVLWKKFEKAGKITAEYGKKPAIVWKDPLLPRRTVIMHTLLLPEVPFPVLRVPCKEDLTLFVHAFTEETLRWLLT